jgi:hypothetical protein
MNNEQTRASRKVFEQLTLGMNTAARQNEAILDDRTPQQLFAHDPDDDDDYAEADISAIWFGWRLHLSYVNFVPASNESSCAHDQQH